MSPHLFTHLFHEGVIVSTRKLVYDASASEDAIKSLMQAQHKAVLKDLKIHTFDDKIDAYLGNAPGLEPRHSVGGGPRLSDPEISVEDTPPDVEPELRAGTEPGGPPTEQIELRAPEPGPPPPKAIPAVVIDEPSKPRTRTAERTSRASQFRSIPPPEATPTAPTFDDSPDMTVPTPRPLPPRTTPRAATPPPIPQRGGVSKTSITLDSSPEIEIIGGESESGHMRAARDTAVDNSFEDAVPAAIGPDATIPSDGIPPRPVTDRPSSPSRPPPGAAQGAALLPAMRQPSRPAITTPSVVSRPLPPDPNRNRGESEAIEIYAPAPPSVEPPPGERAERPGQYSMNRRRDIASQENVPLRDHTGRVAVPAGLARPRPANQSGGSPVVRPGSASSPPLPTPPLPRSTPPSQSDGIVRNATQPPSDGVPQIDEPGLPRRGSVAEGQRGGIDEPGVPRRGSVAEGQRGGIDEPGVPRRGSVAEGQRGGIDEPGVPRRGSVAEGQRGGIDEPGVPRRGSVAEGQRGGIDEPGVPRRGSVAEGQRGGIDEPGVPRRGSVAEGQRVPTPTRTPHITAPIASRTGTGNAPNSGNVITTRPAVIVGAPPRPPGTPTPSRVRKAREDEGRGFGQGLISEKSLDEVILAYLSEDADEK